MTYQIKWSSSVTTGNVKIELFKGNSVDKVLANSVSNSGTFDWEVTTEYATGNNYSVKVTHLTNSSLVSQSPVFTIRKEMILSVPYKEDFNDWSTTNKATGNWMQSTDDDIDWTVLSGPTPSRTGSTPDQTGPKEGDYPDANGKYIYIEASGDNNPNKKASIVTPKFDFSKTPTAKLLFYYHMFSGLQVMGKLYLDVQVGKDGTWQEGKVSFTNNDYGDQWNVHFLDLNFITAGNYTVEQKKRVRFRLRGITSSDTDDGWCSDICIDMFSIDTSLVSINNSVHSAVNKIELRNSKLLYTISENEKLSNVNIKLFNIQGKLINTLVNKIQRAGNYSIAINRNDLVAHGVYLCRVEIAGFQKTFTIINN